MTQHEFIKKSVTILVLAALLICCMVWDVVSFKEPDQKETAQNVQAAAKNTSGSAITTGVQGVWISFGDYKSAGLYNKSKSTFTNNADAYFKKLKKDGMNTIYFHTVPCNDAIYPSKYLDWTSYMFKSSPDYDPLEILIENAHKYDLSFHAWLNPYRKSMGVSYNPGKASSLNRIVRIVKEIIQNYDVDGIHFDDYFYPAKARGAQYSRVSIAKRKKVINKMVKKVYQTVKNYDENLLFGISPAGNTEYAESLGCDLSTWLSKDGYIDYIIPQIYWSDQYRMNGKTVALYTERLYEWISLDENNTPMYIGLALYRAGSSSSTDRGWKKKSNNIVKQIKALKSNGCEGFVLFSSAYMYKSTCKKEMTNYRNYIRKNNTF